ncbi:acylphosphatase [Bauldia sp.]|uniref:acylphosphatase n=1 Tax=Bauldia sp. TaxID=2575872 RepID=UPI003BA9A8AC
MERRTIRIIVHGRVQGVGYRAWLAKRAARFGLNGWVRNRSDGTVEAVLSGPAPDVDNAIAASRQGPRAADVSRIETDTYDEVVTDGFKTRPTV